MASIDGCDASFGELNKVVLNNLFHEARLKYSKIAPNKSLPETNTLAVNITSGKYKFVPSLTLSDLNEELRGCFDYTSTNNDILQSRSEVLAKSSLFTTHLSKSSINHAVFLQDTTETPIE